MSTLTIKCACCGEPLTAPERTEYVDAHRVRHVWKCEPCNYSFSATIAAPKRRHPASLQTSEWYLRVQQRSLFFRL